ncbi:MAG: lipoprotein insertase outer membrane protein LolB [Succinivibrio sp.]
MKKNEIRLMAAAIAAACALLAGCSTTPSLPAASASWEQNYQKLSSLRFFKASGRIGIMTPTERKGAAYDIDGFGSGFIFNINSPMGGTVASITVTDNRLALTMDGKTYEDDTAKAVFEKAFGIDVPAERIERIFLGVPGGSVKRDSDGRITGSDWDGFDIGYNGSVTEGGYTLPEITTVVHGPYTLKLSVIEFKPGRDAQ